MRKTSRNNGQFFSYWFVPELIDGDDGRIRSPSDPFPGVGHMLQGEVVPIILDFLMVVGWLHAIPHGGEDNCVHPFQKFSVQILEFHSNVKPFSAFEGTVGVMSVFATE